MTFTRVINLMSLDSIKCSSDKYKEKGYKNTCTLTWTFTPMTHYFFLDLSLNFTSNPNTEACGIYKVKQSFSFITTSSNTTELELE